jgi:hypothetical protein
LNLFWSEAGMYLCPAMGGVEPLTLVTAAAGSGAECLAVHALHGRPLACGDKMKILTPDGNKVACSELDSKK